MKKKKNFTWLSWDFDFDGDAYVIAKEECPKIEDVPDYICKNDFISERAKEEMEVEEGWCKYQCRSDWYDSLERGGGYVVEKQKEPPKDLYGKKKSGWFPVWIVRKGYWY